MIESLFSILSGHPVLCFFAATIGYLISNYFNHGLNKYPGPVLASLTNIWRFVDVWRRRPDITHTNLHRKHGDIVRLGPNALSFANPKALKDIYGLNKGFIKSGFYPVQMSVSKGRRLPSLFSTTDEQFHASLRRCVNNAFSMSSLIQYEPFVDTTTEVFLDQTEEVFASKSAPCNFTQWLQFYAFDVIGQITYSKRHGFIDSVEDVEGMVNYLAGVFSYSAPIGQMPWLDLVFIKNPILQLLDRLGILNSTFPVVKFAQARMRERLTETKEIEGKQRSDLLSMFLKAQKDHPDFMTDPRVLTLAVSMAFAGSDTTAISLSSVFYYLLKNPRCYQKLQQEIATAVEDGKIEDRPNGLITWAESQKLPYLDACIKEAFRMHPAAGLPLERVTPPQGTTICGEHIAGGTIVGCSAWIIHHRPEIFGIDADIYRPERWLEADEKCLKEMNGTMFQFGMGARTCIGKNISLLEIYKLVPSFLRRFDIHLLNPEKEWKLHNAWFVKQHDFYTTFTTKKMMMATTFAG